MYVLRNFFSHAHVANSKLESLDKLVELDYLSQERRDDIGNALLINTPQTQQNSSVLVKQEFSPDNANWDVNNSFCTGVTEL